MSDDGFRETEVTDFPVEIHCRVCSKPITLFFNGGELDQARCCGYRYELRATGYVLAEWPESPHECE